MQKYTFHKKPWKKKPKQFLKTPLSKLLFISILTIIILWFIWNIIKIRNIFFGFLTVVIITVLLFLLIIESILQSKPILKFLKKYYKFKKIPNIFEYIFFLTLFLATICATFAAAALYLGGRESEVFINYWWFVIFYGIAIVSGFYHYIRRIDE